MNEQTGPGPLPGRRPDRGGESRLLVPALLLSAIIHAAALLVLSFRVPTEPAVSASPISRIVHVAPAMQAFDLVEVAGDAAVIDVLVTDRAPLRPTVMRPAVPPVMPVDEITDVPAHADPMAVRDRLRYRLATPQVWRPPSEEIIADVSPQEVVEQRIAAQLAEYNDSVAAESAAHERAMDWTVKTEDGQRWGVSPGAIHLGSVTIPVGNTHFAVAPGRREEFAGRVRTWNEIQDQAVREEARGTFKDRVKAIEERMDRERAARGAAPPKKADSDAKSDPPEAKRDAPDAKRDPPDATSGDRQTPGGN